MFAMPSRMCCSTFHVGLIKVQTNGKLSTVRNLRFSLWTNNSMPYICEGEVYGLIGKAGELFPSQYCFHFAKISPNNYPHNTFVPALAVGLQTRGTHITLHKMSDYTHNSIVNSILIIQSNQINWVSTLTVVSTIRYTLTCRYSLNGV